MFIAVDPGLNVGVATFNADGSDLNRTIMRLDKFRSFLKLTLAARGEMSVINFIMEDFKLRHDKATDQTGSDMPASRCIGTVEMVSDILGDKSKIYLQKPGDLKGALKWAGFAHLANKPRSYHVPDDIAAYAHGVHRLIDLGLRKHPIFDSE
jgi:hypothetical protein